MINILNLREHKKRAEARNKKYLSLLLSIWHRVKTKLKKSLPRNSAETGKNFWGEKRKINERVNIPRNIFWETDFFSGKLFDDQIYLAVSAYDRSI